MPKVQFKKRKKTLFFSVINRNENDKSFEDMFCEARREGEFDVEFHYLIHRDGKIDKGRDEDTIGGRRLPSNEVSIFIVVDVDKAHERTDAQKVAVVRLLDKLRKKYPKSAGVLTYDIY